MIQEVERIPFADVDLLLILSDRRIKGSIGQLRKSNGNEEVVKLTMRSTTRITMRRGKYHQGRSTELSWDLSFLGNPLL